MTTEERIEVLIKNGADVRVTCEPWRPIRLKDHYDTSNGFRPWWLVDVDLSKVAKASIKLSGRGPDLKTALDRALSDEWIEGITSALSAVSSPLHTN